MSERIAYATRELDHGARVHRDAADLLSETSDLLAATAKELGTTHPDHMHLLRVSRRLSSTALLLAGGEKVLRDLQKDRPCRRLHGWLPGAAFLILTLAAAVAGYGFWRRNRPPSMP